MKKILSIIGASGFIGSHLYRFFHQNAHSDYAIRGTYFQHKRFNDLDKLDVTNPAETKDYLLTVEPDFLILLSGNKNVSDCQTNPVRAHNLNTRPLEDFIRIIEKFSLKTKLFFFSSDYVFDGQKGPYTEDDPATPHTYYGKSKQDAEKMLIESDIDYVIIRSAAVMGRGGNFFEWLLNALSSETQTRLFVNTYFSPTPVNFLNEIMEALLNAHNTMNKHIIHVVGEKRLNRYEFGRMVAETLKKDPSLVIPETADLTNTLFQPDLSMKQSAFVRSSQRQSLERYIEHIVYDDAVY